MTKRVAIILIALLMIAGFFIGVATYRPAVTMVEVHIGWEAYNEKTCSASVKKMCVVSLSLIAFQQQDGSAIMVANHIDPSATGYTVLLPEGTYDVWVVAAGYDSQGAFSTSNPAKITIMTDTPQQPSTPDETEPEPAAEKFNTRTI
jgi:hypothetical protein